MVRYLVDDLDDLPYDPSDRESILSYAARLRGRTLRQLCDIDAGAMNGANKGRLGQALEMYYFKYEPNSDQEPDFPEVGLELKTNPIKRLKNEDISAKERLVITMIDYCALVNEEWETSTVRKKLDDILLVSYLHDPEADILDYEFKYAAVQAVTDEDMAVIRADWETILAKVRAGRAHELSGSDTNYLEACTKGANAQSVRKQPFSGEPAKQRAFALKASYMTAFYRDLGLASIPRTDEERQWGLEKLVRTRFDEYRGMTESSLSEKFGISSHAKNFHALLTKAILGIGRNDEIGEFVKAGIIVKTVRLESDGDIKEHMSFPAFGFADLLDEESWSESAFGRICEGGRFLFVVFKRNGGEFVLQGCSFWRMPECDIDCARDTWEETRRVVARGIELRDVSLDPSRHRYANNLPGSSFNGVAHVRPHATKSAYRFEDGTEVGNVARDASELPDGRAMTRQGFWLDRSYVAKQLRMLGY